MLSELVHNMVLDTDRGRKVEAKEGMLKVKNTKLGPCSQAVCSER